LQAWWPTRAPEPIGGGDDAGLDGVSTYEHRGRPLLLDLAGHTSLRTLAGPWADRVDVVTATVAADSWGTDAVLIRPDGYALWSAQGTPTDAEALRAALLRWFGSEAG
jgi:hypothetical protein